MAKHSAHSFKVKILKDLQAGRHPQAVKRGQQSLKQYPNDPDLHNLTGLGLIEIKKFKTAAAHFKKALSILPQHLQFAENYANSLLSSNRWDLATDFIDERFDDFPKSKEFARLKRELETRRGRWKELAGFLSRLLESDPQNIDLLLERGQARDKAAHADGAAADYRRAYELDPTRIDTSLRMALVLRQTGDRAGAVEILSAKLAENPNDQSLLPPYALLAPSDERPGLRARITEILETTESPSKALYFSLADLTEMLDGREAAMPLYQRANQIAAEADPIDRDGLEQEFARVIELFPNATSVRSKVRLAPRRPIFVVGQPRSGTTLMELMISQSPDVAGCGELALCTALSKPFVENGKSFGTEEAAEFARDYMAGLPPIPTDCTAFTDKLPNNYRLLGFVLASFPDARVINMLRDPRDAGLSAWTRSFSAPAMNYTNSLEEIARVANYYRRYMAHWQSIETDRIMTVQYEDLVQDPVGIGRSVAAFCDIPWVDEMGRPRENRARVKTASIDQVRQDIHTGAIGGWQSLGSHLQPMIVNIDRSLWPEYKWEQ